MRRAKAALSPQAKTIAGLAIASLAVLMPEARSIDQISQSKAEKQKTTAVLVGNRAANSAERGGLKPVPGNRADSAKHSVDENRNPFLIHSVVGPGGSAQTIGSTSTAGGHQVRLTGIVGEGSEMKALMEDGVNHESLAVGQPLDLGGLKGLGFVVRNISFDQGRVTISNGRMSTKITIDQ